MRVAETGRASFTQCEALNYGSYHSATVTKVRLTPTSGRRHQLRVHCAKAGVPIVGDATYIPNEFAYYTERHVPPRMMLHAHTLHIRLPPADAPLRKGKRALDGALHMQFCARDPFENMNALKLQHINMSHR